MQKSSNQEADDYVSFFKRNVDKTNLSKMDEAEILRALAAVNFISTIASDITKIISGPFKWFAKIMERSRLRNELYGLNDHMLSDIGISRGEIEGIVNGTIKRVRHHPIPEKIEYLKQPKATAVVQKQQDDTPIAA